MNDVKICKILLLFHIIRLLLFIIVSENDAFHFGIEFHFAFDLCVASKFPLCVVIFNVNDYVCVTRHVYSIVFITSLRFDRIMLIIDFSEKISHSFIVVAVIIVDIIIIRCSCCLACMLFNKLEILIIAHLYFEWKCGRQSQIQIQSMWRISDVVVFFRETF